MFIVFDKISSEPFIVLVRKNRKQPEHEGTRAIVACDTEADAMALLHDIFGKDGDQDDWILFRYAIFEYDDDIEILKKWCAENDIRWSCRNTNGELRSEDEIIKLLEAKK